jgi:hypothetical protein
MNRLPSAGIQRRLLIAHFFRQFFNNELVPRQTESRATLIQILALVATPGFLIMCGLLRKYARLAPMSPAAANMAALDEKCLFVYFSMVVIGFVAIVEWDALFPDRRDCLTFGHLPIRTREIFLSKAGALCLFLGLFSLFVNAFPVVSYPLFASRGLLHAIRFAFSHAVSVFAGNAFIFFACISVQGVLLNVFGPRLRGVISRFVQLSLLVSLLTVFFLMPGVSYEVLRRTPAVFYLFAPAWFLGLYQVLLAGPSPEFSPLAWRAFAALVIAVSGFAGTYAMAYKRQLSRVLETGGHGTGNRIRASSVMAGLFHRAVLPDSSERAAFYFVVKTVLRSPSHRTYIGAYMGAGLALVVMGVLTLILRHGIAALASVRSELLSIPLVMSFFILLGMRVVFSIPAQLRANWIFRITEGDRQDGCLSGVRKAMFWFGLAPLFALLFFLYTELWGFLPAALHTAYCTVLSLLLIEVLLYRFDRIPFACTYVPGRANLKLWWPAYLFGFTNYAYSMTGLEQKMFRTPRYFLLFFAAAAALLLSLALRRNRIIGGLQGFRYEAEVAPIAEPLSLGCKPD